MSSSGSADNYKLGYTVTKADSDRVFVGQREALVHRKKRPCRLFIGTMLVKTDRVMLGWKVRRRWT